MSDETLCYWCRNPAENVRTVMGEPMCLICLHGEDNE